MPASDSFQSDGSGGRPVTVIVPVSPMAVGAEGSALSGRFDRVLPGDLLNRVCVRCGAEGTEAGRLRCGKRLSRPFKMFLVGVPLIVVAGTVAMVLAGQGFWDVFLLPVLGFGFWTIVVGKWFQAGQYWERTRLTFFMCPDWSGSDGKSWDLFNIGPPRANSRTTRFAGVGLFCAPGVPSVRESHYNPALGSGGTAAS